MLSIKCGVCSNHQAEEENLRQIYKWFIDWDVAKNRIYPILIPKENNISHLEELVWLPKLDLVIAFAFRCYNTHGDIGCIKVKREMLDVWNVTVDDIYSNALVNMKSDGYKLVSGKEMIFNLCEPDEGIPDADIDIYLLTNKCSYYGAAGVINDDFLRNNINGDSYIFPSSVDEVFVCPVSGLNNITGEQLYQLVEEVNRNFVSKNQFLSNNVYFYNAKTGELSIAERTGD